MSKLGDMGLGIIIGKIRFCVTPKKMYYGHGYKIHKHLYFNKCTETEVRLIQLWAEENDLLWQHKKRIGKRKDIELWLDALSPYEDLLTDQKGLTRIKWVFENPIPHASFPFDSFLEWASAWDALNDGF